MLFRSERHEWLSSDLRLFLAVGFCGGFTTFSAFAFENAELLRGSHYFSFIAYAALTFILGIGCAAAGYAVGKI